MELPYKVYINTLLLLNLLFIGESNCTYWHILHSNIYMRLITLLLLLSHFSRVWLYDPIPGILQARTLEWVAISFSNAEKWKVKVKSFSHVRLFVTPWTAAYQAPPSMGFSRQECGVGCHYLLRAWSYSLLKTS